MSRYGTPRLAHPSITSSIAAGRLISTKKSAGPPMPKDVRDASGSSSLTPGSERSQLTLGAVRQLIAQLVDITGAHQEQQVARPDKTLEHLSRGLEITHVGSTRDLMRQIRSFDTGSVVLAGAVHVQDEYFVRAVEGSHE